MRRPIDSPPSPASAPAAPPACPCADTLLPSHSHLHAPSALSTVSRSASVHLSSPVREAAAKAMNGCAEVDGRSWCLDRTAPASNACRSRKGRRGRRLSACRMASFEYLHGPARTVGPGAPCPFSSARPGRSKGKLSIDRIQSTARPSPRRTWQAVKAMNSSAAEVDPMPPGCCLGSYRQCRMLTSA